MRCWCRAYRSTQCSRRHYWQSSRNPDILGQLPQDASLVFGRHLGCDHLEDSNEFFALGERELLQPKGEILLLLHRSVETEYRFVCLIQEKNQLGDDLDENSGHWGLTRTTMLVMFSSASSR